MNTIKHNNKEYEFKDISLIELLHMGFPKAATINVISSQYMEFVEIKQMIFNAGSFRAFIGKKENVLYWFLRKDILREVTVLLPGMRLGNAKHELIVLQGNKIYMGKGWIRKTGELLEDQGVVLKPRTLQELNNYCIEKFSILEE